MGIDRDFIQENFLDQVDELARRVRVLEETMLTAVAFVGAKYRTDAGQSIPNITATIINYEDEEYDTHDAVTVGASWKFTAPFSGYYHVSAAALFSSTTTWAETEIIEFNFYKNGTKTMTLDRPTGLDSSGGAQYFGAAGSTTIYLAPGDYIDIRIYQDSGGALALYNSAIYNYVAIEKVG